MPDSPLNTTDTVPTSERVLDAHREVGATTITTSLARIMTGLFLVSIAWIPLFQNWSETERREQWVGESMRIDQTLPSADSVRYELGNGFSGLLGLSRGVRTSLDQFENQQEQDAILNKLFAPILNRGAADIRSDMNESVYRGHAGWLFYRPSIDYITGPGFLDPKVLRSRSIESNVQSNPLDAIIEFRDALRAQGIELVLAPAPAKAMIYPEYFAGTEIDTPMNNRSYASFIEQLEAAEINHVDLVSPLHEAKTTEEELLYLPTDTHWSPRGMAIAADEIAEYLRATELVSSRRLEQYIPAKTGPMRGRGDLVSMMAQRGDSSLYADIIGAETLSELEKIETYRLEDPEGYPWKPDADASILLLGDSFSNIFASESLGWGKGMGLAERLSSNLGQSLDTIRINDMAAHATRESLALDVVSGNRSLDKVKVVVWEFAIRELAFGDWRRGYSYEPSTSVISPDEQLTSRARVLDVAVPPPPNETPYPDWIMSVEIQPVDDSGDPLAEVGPRIVYLWGMRGHKPDENTRLKVGDLLELTLTPWKDANINTETVSRADLVKSHQLTQPRFWGEMDSAGNASSALTPPDDIDPIESETSSEEDQQARDELRREREQPIRDHYEATLRSNEKEFLRATYDLLDDARSEVFPFADDDGWFVPKLTLERLLKGTEYSDATTRTPRNDGRFLYAENVVDTILDFDRQLKERGIELLLVPIPEKNLLDLDRLYSEHLRYADSIEFRPDRKYRALYDILEEQGVHIFDLYPALWESTRSLGRSFFLIDDHHFGPEGVQLVARLLAQQIRLLDLDTHSEPAELRLTESELSYSGSSWHTRYRDAGFLEDHRSTITAKIVEQHVPGGDPEWVPLEENPESPILIIGNSFIQFLGRNFETEELYGGAIRDHLAYELGHSIDWISILGEDGGINGVRAELARDASRLHSKKVIVWCFSGSNLVETDTGWTPIALP